MLTTQLLREVLGRGFDGFHVKAVRTILKEDRVHLEAFVNIGSVNYSMTFLVWALPPGL